MLFHPLPQLLWPWGGRAGGSRTAASDTGSEEQRQKVELKGEIKAAVGQGERKDSANGRGGGRGLQNCLRVHQVNASIAKISVSHTVTLPAAPQGQVGFSMSTRQETVTKGG